MQASAGELVAMRRAQLGESLLARLATMGVQGRWSADGGCLELRDAAGERGRIGFDAAGWIAAYESPMKRLWRFRSDAYGQLLEAISPAQCRWSLRPIASAEDAQMSRGVESSLLACLPAQFTNSLGAAVFFAYDGRAELFALHFGDGTACAIETAGSAVAGLRAQPSFAPLDQVWRVVDRTRVQASFTWDAIGRLETIDPGDGRRIVLRYPDEHTVETHLPDGLGERCLFDAKNRLSAVTSCDRTVHVEGMHLLRYDGGVEVEFTTNDAGALTKATLREGGETRTTTLAWDDGGRIVSDGTSDAVQRCIRDARGLPLRLSSGADQPVEYTWNADGELSGVRDWLGARHSIERAANGVDEMLTWASGVRIFTRRDPMDRVLSVNVAAGGSSLFSQICRYDAQGLPVALSDSVDTDIALRYDKAGRLQEWSCPTRRRLFTRDAIGRITSIDAAAAELDRGGKPLRLGGEQLTWDDSGRLIRRISPDGHAWTYRWCPRGLLAAVVTPTGVETRFEHDALGRPCSRHTAATDTTFRWMGDIFAGDETIHRGNGASQRRDFAAHPLTGEPFLMRRRRRYADSAAPVTDEVFVLHPDCLGSPRLVTSAAGAIVWTSSAGPFGDITPRNTALDLPVRAGGFYADVSNEVWLSSGRAFLPELGLYLAPNPEGLLAGADLYGLHAPNDWLAGLVGLVAAQAGVLAGQAALAAGASKRSRPAELFTGARLASWLFNGLQRPWNSAPEDTVLPRGRPSRLWPDVAAPPVSDPLGRRLETGLQAHLRSAIGELPGPMYDPAARTRLLQERLIVARSARPPRPLPVFPQPRNHNSHSQGESADATRSPRQ